MKPFKLSGQSKENKLFDYSIEVSAKAELISTLNLKSQRISMNSTATTVEKKIITNKDIRVFWLRISSNNGAIKIQ